MEQPVTEREAIVPKQEPILETAESVSYLGVRLPKATNPDSPFIPDRSRYADYTNDRFSLDLQRSLAVSFLGGDPVLVEGGTSIGKTTTARKMASELGWEVHYVNLNGATDVEDLMGRYIPNPNKRSPDDPEFVFADGKVTSALRQEEGKIKMLVLDEFNSGAPNIVIRLHEVLDALGRNEAVVLAEDASETVKVDKEKTKVVGFMNPPGKGYFGREPIDPAQLRRWVYQKAPTDLPDETFSHATDALFGLASQIAEVPEDEYLPSRDLALLPEQLQEIPGIKEINDKYKEFHKGAKALVRERAIGADQPQQFTFDDRMEPRRVRDFILRFYNGDINDTFKNALRYYYSNKLLADADAARLEELIQHVEYIPPQNESQRRPLDEPEPTRPETQPGIPSTEVARREQVAWREMLGSNVDVKPLPDTITDRVKEKLDEFGLELVYVPKLNIGTIDTLKTMGVEGFIDQLQRNYPKWKHYEKMSDSDKEDHSKTRNLNERYWGLVKDGNVDFPELPGQWVAIEKMPKPNYGEQYEHTKVGDRIGHPDRFSVSWNDAKDAIDMTADSMVTSDLLVRGTNHHVRMPTALEWNLIANRKGWGSTDTWEWTKDEYRGSGGSRRLIVGSSDNGGAANANWPHPDHSADNLGFRVAVVFDP